MIQITNLNDFIDISEIALQPNPNYEFDTFIGDTDFQFSIQTFVNNDTRITITQNDEIICLNAPISLFNTNLCFFSNYDKGAFFFVRNQQMTNPVSYLDFGTDDLRLLYGNFE